MRLIELLVVCGILITLAGLLLPCCHYAERHGERVRNTVDYRQARCLQWLQVEPDSEWEVE